MKTYDVIILTDKGEFKATLDAEDNIPTGLLLQAVMSHQQTLPLLVELGANNAKTIVISSFNQRLKLPVGLTVELPDGVAITGPIHPSPIPDVPKEFDGVRLTSNLAVVVTLFGQLGHLE